MPLPRTKCRTCKEFFQPRDKTKVFCSVKCSGVSSGLRRRTGTMEKCSQCGELFYLKAYLKKLGVHRCSMKCRSKAMKGRSGEKHPRWKGGRRKSSWGYILVFAPLHPLVTNQGCVFEHRLIAEKALGRFLTATEVIHHLNEIRDDNRLENLYLCKDTAEHMRIHALQKKGVKIVSNLI